MQTLIHTVANALALFFPLSQTRSGCDRMVACLCAQMASAKDGKDGKDAKANETLKEGFLTKEGEALFLCLNPALLTLRCYACSQAASSNLGKSDGSYCDQTGSWYGAEYEGPYISGGMTLWYFLV
jgi:hypothetical protein